MFVSNSTQFHLLTCTKIYLKKNRLESLWVVHVNPDEKAFFLFRSLRRMLSFSFSTPFSSTSTNCCLEHLSCNLLTSQCCHPWTHGWEFKGKKKNSNVLLLCTEDLCLGAIFPFQLMCIHTVLFGLVLCCAFTVLNVTTCSATMLYSRVRQGQSSQSKFSFLHTIRQTQKHRLSRTTRVLFCFFLESFLVTWNIHLIVCRSILNKSRIRTLWCFFSL